MQEETFEQAKKLLISLIETFSISRSESGTAELLCKFFKKHGIEAQRIENNVIVRSKNFDDSKPTILLNSHHDTVKPSDGWQSDPFNAICEKGKIIGLGSNDAGASLVSLIFTFLHFNKQENNPFNLILVASAEEEISGKNGLECVMPHLPEIAFGIVGEPTGMRMAIAEKGLMVLDCKAIGKSGHAAHSNGINAIYKAIESIQWFQTYQFEKSSDFLGPVKMSVTVINAGTQHNVIPGECSFVVDVRSNEKYTNQELYDTINQSVDCEVNARSFRLNSSSIPTDHPLVESGKKIGLEMFGSPTLSDQVFMTKFPSMKIGPGDTLRSHTANEFIFESELRQGMETYIELLTNLQL
ncbi:MAG: M20 family metallo-hydrolase [Bacteroidales bacterium]|nr:M20 family metallo-hydrolase [Bacteroidales bacterium]